MTHKNGTPLHGARNIWLLIEGGDDLPLADAQDIAGHIYDISDPDTVIVLSVTMDDSLAETLRVTILKSYYPC